MEESHNEDPLNDLPNQHTGANDIQHTENNNKETDIFITKIINKLTKICKNQTGTNKDDNEGDEGEDESDDYEDGEDDYEDGEEDDEDDDEDEYEDESDDIKWKSLEKLLESHNNITRIFIELAKRGEL